MDRLKNCYIGVTSREWFMYLKRNNVIKYANFKKNARQFRSLNSGETFFFLVKNKKVLKKKEKFWDMGYFQVMKY